jgi:protocatechuate 4,5-dioxygenase, alpha chain
MAENGSNQEKAAADYHDIPGTYVFDAAHSRKGYRLNMFCMSLNDPGNRDAFRADEAAYLDRYTLTPEQREAVLGRRWLRLLELGGNIYYTFKLAACDGLSFQQLAALQTGVSEEDYVAMMVGGGRPIEGNRSKSDPRWAQASKGEDGNRNG